MTVKDIINLIKYANDRDGASTEAIIFNDRGVEYGKYTASEMPDERALTKTVIGLLHWKDYIEIITE